MNKSFSASLLPAFSDLHPQSSRFWDVGLIPTHGGNALSKYFLNWTNECAFFCNLTLWFLDGAFRSYAISNASFSMP